MGIMSTIGKAVARAAIDTSAPRRMSRMSHRDRVAAQKFWVWRNEWNEKHGPNGSLTLPEILVDLNPRQQLFAIARGIKTSIERSLASGHGMGDRTTAAQATIEHRRKMMHSPTRPRTSAFKDRYPDEPSKGASGFGYDSGYLAENLKLRKLRPRMKKNKQPDEIGFTDIAYAISPPAERRKAVAIQYNKREPLIALTQRDIDRALQMIIDKVIKVRAPRKKA